MSINTPERVQQSNFILTAKASRLGQSSYDPYDLSSNDEKYVTPQCMAAMTHGRTDHPAHLLTAAGFHLKLKPEGEETKLHRMSNVPGFLEMWQGSQTLRAIERESRAQIKQITAAGHISHTEEIIKAAWSNSQHDGAGAFNLSE
jgi:hypothetical protein